MDKKPKIDLQNGHIGGVPKDWLEREHDKSLEPGLGLKGHALVWGAVLSVAFTLGALALGVFRILF